MKLMLYKKIFGMYLNPTASNVMGQAYEVYSNLQSILLLQESCLTDKIVAVKAEMYEKVNDEKLYSSDTVKNLEDFLNEGKKYLNLANSLNEYNRKDSTIFAIMLKALDIYSRLKIQFLSCVPCKVVYDGDETLYSVNDIDEIYYEDYTMMSDDDELVYSGDETYSVDQVFYNEIFYNNTDIINYDSDDDVGIWDFNDNYIFQQKLCYKIMLVKIQWLIMRIQNVYLTFNRNRLSFSLILTDYCKRLRLLLSNDAEIVKYNKLEKSQLQDIYCKCNLLKELLENLICPCISITLE